MKDIQSRNDKHEWHGYQERYHVDNLNKLFQRGNWKNGFKINYIEFHGVKHTNYYIR